MSYEVLYEKETHFSVPPLRRQINTPVAFLRLTRHLALQLQQQLTAMAESALQPLAAPVHVDARGQVTLTYLPATVDVLRTLPPPPAVRAREARRLVRAVTQAHQHQLVHGDLGLASVVRAEDGRLAVVGMGFPNLQIPTLDCPSATADEDLRALAPLVRQLLTWQEHPASAVFPDQWRDLPNILLRLQNDPEDRRQAVHNLQLALGRAEADLLPPFGFSISRKVLDRAGVPLEELQRELQGPLEASMRRGLADLPSSDELYTPGLCLCLRPDKLKEGHLFLVDVRREQPPVEQRQNLRPVPLRFQSGEGSGPLMEWLSTLAVIPEALPSEALARWTPHRVGLFVHKQNQEQYDQERRFRATVTRLDDGRDAHRAVVRIDKARPYSSKADPKASWRNKFADARDMTLTGLKFRARGVAYDQGNLELEVLWGTLEATCCVELVDQGMKALLERQEQADGDFQAGKAANPRIPGILLNPSTAREAPPSAVPRLYQDLHPAEEVQRLVSRILAAPDLFALQGPPGTGKTTIITEVILHELARNPQVRILVTSQSSEAVKNVFDRLDRLRANPDVALPKAFLTYRDDRKSPDSPDYLAWAEAVRTRSQACGHPALAEWRQNIKHRDTRDEYIRAANVYGSTLTRLPPLLSTLPDIDAFDLVIVDEAARAGLFELLIAVVRGKRVLLVGDHLQLPPTLEHVRQVQLRAEGFKDHEIRTSLFEALFAGLAHLDAPPLPSSLRHTLDTQYRMHDSIGRLVSRAFYRGRLHTGTGQDRSLPMPGLNARSRALWWNLPGVARDHATGRGERRWFNQEQLDGTRTLLRNLDEALTDHPPPAPLDLAVICAYREQATRTQQMVRELASELQHFRVRDIKVDTVDAFQGQERDIIVYVFTRSATDTGWVIDPRRLNVAFSRARRLLIVIGDLNRNLWQGHLKRATPSFIPLPEAYKEPPGARHTHSPHPSSPTRERALLEVGTSSRTGPRDTAPAPDRGRAQRRRRRPRHT